MHLLLVDKLSCPRCGPSFGLVLLARRVTERRVLEGALGCPNCRDQYPVVDGFGDLRAPPRKRLTPTGDAVQPPVEETVRLAAFLGVGEGPANVALVGTVAAHATELSGMIPELEVAAVHAGVFASSEEAGVSRMISAPGLAFKSNVLRGIALDWGAVRSLEEAARVVVPGGRVVIYGMPEDGLGKLGPAGLRVVAREGDLVVTERAGPRLASEGVRLPIV